VGTELIVRHWDELLRVAGSLKMGAISASELTRSLLRSNCPSTLARAIGELGRVAKTLYLLPSIDDETYRRRILTQLNRSEGRHGVARTVFYGQRGESGNAIARARRIGWGRWAWWSTRWCYEIRST
jgi:TnpA family transposase